MQFNAETRVIASIWPLQLTPIERPYAPSHTGGSTRFALQPYTLEDFKANADPKTLEITDCWQVTKRPDTGETLPQLVAVEVIANDLIREWQMRDYECKLDVGPGVWICAGSGPSQSEIEFWKNKQARYLEWLFYKGQQIFEEKKQHLIDDRHRTAGLWLGKEEPWVKNLYAPDVKATCPACKSPVDPDAFVCATCHLTIRALPPELAKLQPGAVFSTPVKPPVSAARG